MNKKTHYLNVRIDPGTEKDISRLVRRGDFESKSEVIREAVRLLVDAPVSPKGLTKLEQLASLWDCTPDEAVDRLIRSSRPQ